MSKNIAQGFWVKCEANLASLPAAMFASTVQFDGFATPGPGISPLGTRPFDAEPAGRLLHQQRLTAVLRGVVEGFDVAAAELCLLDDLTAELRRAADYGDQASAGPRLLEDARADVAALAGGAVVLEDAEMVAEWPVPRPCRAAVCVPVASDTTIHGTMWVYSNQPRAFDDRELQLIEIAAGRLAVEVERRRLLDARPATTLSAAPRLPQPSASTELGELELGGRSEAASHAVHDWAELPDGRLMLLAASVVDMPGGRADEAVLAAQAARVAARCHAESDRLMDAGELLTRVARSVWQATPGGEGLSLAVAIVDPSDCTGTYALAGGAVAMSVRAGRTIVESTDAPPAGWDHDERYESHSFELSLRERLVLSVVDPRLATPARLEKLAEGYRGISSESHRAMTAQAAADMLCDQADAPQAAVAVRWK